MENIKLSWLNIFDKYNNQTIYTTLPNILLQINQLREQYKERDSNNVNIFPKQDDILKCFNYFEVNETKVVILGQDPYHGPGQATGLCFGIGTGTKKIPPSLKNIAKELSSDISTVLHESDYSLEKWAKQGVLMLNASLSVIQQKPGSHMNMWSSFTSFIINELNQCDHSIIFIAWGAFAHEKMKNIDLNKHHIIVSSHPSPLSVYKKYKEYPAFKGSMPFSQVNNILSDRHDVQIVW